MAIVMEYVLGGYFLLINFVSFVTMAVDKRKATKRRWRIPEKTLFLQAVLGGCIGALAGMYCFRHKTKHRKFVVGMPLILVGQIGLAIFAVWFWSL